MKIAIISHVDWGGMCTKWATAIDTLTPHHCQHFHMVEHPFKYPNSLPIEEFDRDEWDIIHLNEMTPNDILIFLSKYGKQVRVVSFQGSMLRTHFTDEYNRILKDSSLIPIVGSPDLLECIDGDAVFIPPTFPLDCIDLQEQHFDNNWMIVAHSAINPQLRGSGLFMAACMALRGRLKVFRIGFPPVSNERNMEWKSRANFYFDGVGFGMFGINTLECLAMGRPVVVEVSQQCQRYYEEFGGMKLPFQLCDASNIYEKLEEMLDRDKIAEMSTYSREWIKSVLHPSRISEMLVNTYGL